MPVQWLVLAACSADPSPADAAWEPRWPDESGRHVMHRGMNVNNAAKRSEDNLPGLADHELDLLVSHGITLVRYLVFWHAVEPVEGEVDRAYLERVAEDIGRLTQRGLSVIVDMHQDIYGEGFGHAGMPRWTCEESLYESFQAPEGSWYLAYARPEVQECFDRFWASEALQQAYAQAWAEVAAAVSEDPGVVAFEVMNEPFWGTLQSETFEQEVLPAFYTTVAGALPQGRLVVVEPSVSANLTHESSLTLPEGDWVFAPHYYPVYAEEGTGWSGDFGEEEKHLRQWADQADRLGLPLLVGEFGIFSDFGNEPDYVRALLETVGNEGGSAAYWSYDRNDSWGPLTSDGQAGAGLEGFSEPWLHRTPGPFVSTDQGWRVTGTAVQANVEVVVPGACTPAGDWDSGRRVLSFPAPEAGEEVLIEVEACPS